MMSYKIPLSLSLCILLGFASNAQVNVNDLKTKRVVSDNTIIWQQVSPGNGGMSNTLRYHPTIPEHVTFLGDMWCGYQSENNGKRWKSITDHDGQALFSRQRDLLYSTSHPNFGISVCSSLLWKTEDIGKSWQPVTNCPWYDNNDDGMDRSHWLSKVAGLGIDPTNKNIWFVGGGKFVRGDVTFSCYKAPTQAEPYGPSVTNEGKLWRTKNGGDSWTEVGKDLPSRAQVGPVKFDPRNSQIVFAATTHGVFRSEDGGDSWSNITQGKVDNNVIMDLDYYYNASTNTFILYLIDQVQYEPDGATTKSTGGIYQSTDNGNTWENINGDIYLDFSRLQGGVSEAYYKYIARWFGMSVSEAKSTYSQLPTKALQLVSQLSTDPTRKGALYVGMPSAHTVNSVTPGRLWKTDDSGENWTNTARLYTKVWEKDRNYWESRGNPWQQNMTIGIESAHVQWGDNYALRGVRGLDVGVDGSVMMMSEHTTSLSKDHGETWTQVDSDFTPSGAFLGRGNSDMPAHVIQQDKRYSQTMLGSGEHRLFITRDDSPDERQAIANILSAPETVDAIAFDPMDANTLYLTSSRQQDKQYIFKSSDSGESWEIHGTATPATDAWGDDYDTNALTIDPTDNKYMYHGITNIADRSSANRGGFFRSSNGGEYFTQSNQGLPNPVRVYDIQFDPRDDTNASLFIAAQKNAFNYHSPLAEGGLYHSSDRGISWKRVNTPDEVESVEYIRFDNTDRLYITTGFRGGGHGLWYTDDFGETWAQAFAYPGMEHLDVSHFDHNIIVAGATHLSKNPGVYISRDRGVTWSKSNTNIAVPNYILDIKMDIHNAGQVWLGTLGNGFYKGQIIDGDKIQVVKTTPTSLNSDGKLNASIVNPDYSDETISWGSDNPTVATVDQNGNVTLVGKGSTKIWASAVNGRFADYSIVVNTENNSSVTSLDPTSSKGNDLAIYPNPASSAIYLNTSSPVNKVMEISIYNSSGMLVYNLKSKIDNTRIDIADLVSGLYFIEVKGHTFNKIKKMVKH